MAIQKLAQEDPTFRVNTDPDTGQTIHSRHGRAPSGNHRRPHDARVQSRAPTSANRRWRIAKPFAGTPRPKAVHVKPDRWSRAIRPRQDSSSILNLRAPGSSSTTTSWAARCPRNTSSRSRQGIQEALEGGVLAGYPMSDVKVTLYDGSYHDVDSSEMAFKIAGSMAIQRGGSQARQTGSAGTNHGGRSGDAGRLHGRCHRRPEFAPRTDRRHGASRGTTRSSRRWCRCRRCSDTPPHMRSRTQGARKFTMHFGKYEEVSAHRGGGNRSQGAGGKYY